MSDIKKLLETIDKMKDAEHKPTGPKFPGYWKGKDSASKAKSKMVGSAQESIVKDLHNTAKEKITEWKLQEQYKNFNEQDSKSYTGIDPIVRQRMGMPPATADEIKSYVKQNPPAVKAGDGYLKGLRPEVPVTTDPDERLDVISGGQMDVIDAAVKAAGGIKPERPVDVTDRPPTRSTAASAAQTQQPAAPTQAAPSSAQVNTVPAPITVRPLDGPTPPVIKPSDSAARPNIPSGSNLPGMLSGGGSATWATSPLNPVNQSKAADAAPAVAPAAVAPAAVRPASTATPYRGNQGAREIQAVNPSIKDVNKIQAGQRLKLPDSDEDYVVQKGDTLDKIGKMYRSGEIGGRVVGGEGPTSSSDSRPQPAAPAAAVQPTAPTASGSQPAAAARPAPAASGSQPAAPTVRPAPAASGSQPAAPAAAAQTSATTSQARPTHPPGTQITVLLRDLRDPSKPLNVTLMKGADNKWYDPKGRRANFNKPGDLEKLEQQPALQLPQVVYPNPRPPGVPAGSMSTPNFLTAPVGSFQNYRKGSDGEWYREDGTRVTRSDLIQNLEKNAKTPKPVKETKKQDDLIAGRYDPDDFDLMVKRLGQRAQEQDRKHGPVDLSALAKRLHAIEKREQTKEQEDPAVNKQDPDIQTTSQTSPNQDPAAVKQQQLDQTVDMATAKGTMTGLKNVLGPKVDTNALASAVTKISDQKALTAPESQAMTALTPLISKAAETPQTAMALKTALSNAGMLARQGK